MAEDLYDKCNSREALALYFPRAIEKVAATVASSPLSGFERARFVSRGTIYGAKDLGIAHVLEARVCFAEP